MKKTFILPASMALVLAAATGPAFAEPVRTDPLGLITLSVPAGKTQTLSVPLKTTPLYVGQVSAVTVDTVTTAGAAWEQDAFGPYEENPCVVRIVSGQAAGQSFSILTNTENVLTLDGSEDFTQTVKAGDRYEILPVDTLEELFGADGAGLLTGVNPDAVDNVLVREPAGWVTYYNDGVQWLEKGGDGAARNSAALPPDQGMLFVRRGTTPLRLTITGEVPLTSLVSELPAQATVFLANSFPADTTLQDLGLHKDPSWIAGRNVTKADFVQIYVAQRWQSERWLTFFYDGKRWRQQGGGVKNPLIPKGSAMIIGRRGGADILHAQQPPYAIQ